LLQTHHIACDNESLHLLFSEVTACLRGRRNELPDPLPYRSHVAHAVRRAWTQKAETFFRSRLAEIDEPTAPFGLLDVHGDGSRTVEASQQLESALATRIRAQARSLSVSAAALFHAAWALVVSRTSGRNDVVYGTVLLGRLHEGAGAQRALGMFINTLPLRLRLENITARELVAHTRQAVAELINHEQVSLSVAQRCCRIAASALCLPHC